MENYVLDLNPFLVQFTEAIGIRWYSLAYLGGFVSGYIVMRIMAARKTILLNELEIADLVIYVALGTLIGGRVGYALFYAPELFWDFDSNVPFWGVLKVYQGGMASHGGIMGIMVACWFYARKFKKPYFHLVDLTVLGGGLAIFYGRMANFVNGELFGRAAPEGLSWAVKFPQEMYMWSGREASKLLDLAPAVQALGEVKTRFGEKITVSAELWKGWVSQFGRDSGATAAVEQAVHSLILSVQAGNQQVINALAPILTPRYPSQLIQGLLEGLLVFVVLAIIWRKPQKPGVISGWFGIIYAIARIIGEQFRMPDAHIGFQLLGLTRGQWLSIGMLAAAIAWLVIAMRLDTKKIGGWGQASSKSSS